MLTPQRPPGSTTPPASSSDAPSVPNQGPTLPHVRPSPTPETPPVPSVEKSAEEPTLPERRPPRGRKKPGAPTWPFVAGAVMLLTVVVLAWWLVNALNRHATENPAVRQAQEAWAHYLGRQVEEEDEIAPGVRMKFVLVPPGKFQMGSPKGEDGHEENEVLHEVEITKPFYLGVYDVTQAQYKAVTNKTPSQFSGQQSGPWDGPPARLSVDNLPVETVSCDEADAFAKLLTTRAKDGQVYRLPTEAEWEYSCRGGRPSSLAFGVGNGTTLSTRDANFSDSNLNKTTPVDTYPPNALGLYDMQGNVWQWCSDFYGDYPIGRAVNPRGPAPDVDSTRVSRGGGENTHARYCRAAYRGRGKPRCWSGTQGFRLARVPSGLDK